MSSLFSRRRLIAAGGASAVAAPLAMSTRASAATPAGTLKTLTRPIRVFDSRDPNSVMGGAKLRGGEVVAVTLSAAYEEGDFATAVFANVTITQTEGAGHLAVTAEDLSGDAPPPETSNINWSTSGATIANLVLSPVGGEHAIELHCTGAATHVIVDVFGYVPFVA